jgi:hypothetical protein
MRFDTADMPFTTRTFALCILMGAAAAAFGAESSVLGWTVSNVSLIGLAVALVTVAFEEVFRSALPERYSRMTRIGLSGGFAAMAVATVVAAFRSSAMPV